MVGPDLRDQLKLLESLQDVDIQLKETEQELADLPEKLQDMKADVARVESMLEGERQRLGEAQAYKTDRDKEAKAEQEVMDKARGKLAAVRTSKEYLAVQREFEAVRRHHGEREDEVSKLVTAMDQFQQSVEVHEKELAELKQHVVEEEQKIAGQISELERRAESQRADRKGMLGAIRRDVLRKYENISRRRTGKAVVPAVGGVCSGCNMQLPPQLYNIIQRANSIEQCPTCQRIIYYPESDEEPSSD